MLRKMMITTAAAALLAGPAVAQDDTSVDTQAETETQIETDTGVAADTDIEVGTDVAPETRPLDPMAPTADAPVIDDGFPDTLEDLTVDQMLGLAVVSGQGEDVGEVDYVVDMGVPSAVIGIGGFLGLGEYTVAMPLDEFTLDPEARTVVVSRSEEELRSMPEFDESGIESLAGDLIVGDLMASRQMESVQPTQAETMTEAEDTDSETDETEAEVEVEDTEVETETAGDSDTGSRSN